MYRAGPSGEVASRLLRSMGPQQISGITMRAAVDLTDLVTKRLWHVTACADFALRSHIHRAVQSACFNPFGCLGTSCLRTPTPCMPRGPYGSWGSRSRLTARKPGPLCNQVFAQTLPTGTPHPILPGASQGHLKSDCRELTGCSRNRGRQRALQAADLWVPKILLTMP